MDQVTVSRELLLRIHQHLEREWKSVEPWSLDDSEALSIELQEALEQPAVEPVAEVVYLERGGNAGIATRIVEIDDPHRERLQAGTKLFTAPQARTSQDVQQQPQLLTDEEIALLVREASKGSAIKRDGSTSERIARAAEQAVLKKNGVIT